MVDAIPEQPRETYDPNDFSSLVSEYAKLKESSSFMETRIKEIREVLIAKLDEDGAEDEDGNIVLPFTQPIAGLRGLVKTRRVSRKLNETRALEIIQEHGLENDLIVMVPTIAEDAVMAALYEGVLNENEIDQMFPITVTWALNTKK